MNKRNYYVDILRYFLALDVVFIHQHPLQDFSFNFGYFITVIMPRLANPLFFMISGYYFINKLLEQHGKGVYLSIIVNYILNVIKTFLQKNSAGGNVKEYYIGRIKVLAMERLHRS